MYVRSQKLPGQFRFAVRLCHSVRYGKKVTQKTVKYFGVARNTEELVALQELAAREGDRIKSILKKPVIPPDTSKDPVTTSDIPKWLITPLEISKKPIIISEIMKHMREDARVIEGYHDVFGAMLDRLQLRSLFSHLVYRRLKNVIVGRIATPLSKRGTAAYMTKRCGRPLSEDQIYRLMDVLVSKETVITKKVFEMTRQLSSQKAIDLLLFDVTTLYFESQESDELRDFGYSKDHKIGETQVVLALATTQDGLPIGYTLFSGKTAEVKTLLQCLETWRQEVDIGNMMVTADRAMMSNDNLEKMEQAGVQYTVAAKLKQLPAKLKQEILAGSRKTHTRLDGEELSIKEYKHEGRRLVVSYSPSRARKDRLDRQRLLEKLEQKLHGEGNPKKLVTNRGYLKFLDDETKGHVVINEKKVSEDSLWDGLHGLITNDLTTSAEELLRRYRQLWVIEESFRLNKHSLAMRPIYHFKPSRIRAHVLICYLVFALVRYVQHELKAFGYPRSLEQIRDTLLDAQASILRVGQQTYRLPAQPDKDIDRIYRAVGIRRCYDVQVWEGGKR